jgi:hypothetical protein
MKCYRLLVKTNRRQGMTGALLIEHHSSPSVKVFTAGDVVTHVVHSHLWQLWYWSDVQLISINPLSLYSRSVTQVHHEHVRLAK